MLTENYFPPLLRYFEKEDTFGVSGRIIGWEDDLVQDAAKFPSFHGAKIKTTGNYFLESPGKNDWLYSMYLSGANAFIDRKKLMELHGFDEIFAPFYVEDYELSLRAWRLGWKCYYEHYAVCRHKVSVTIKSKSSKSFIDTVYYRNKMYLHAMHLTGAQLYLWYVQLIPETIIRIFSLRFYYLASLRLFFQSGRQLQVSKDRLAALALTSDKLLSVKEVISIIRKSVENVAIRRF